MRGAVEGLVQHRQQSFSETPTSADSSGGSQWNAFKHGLYSKAILLPGDSAATFDRQRVATFCNYRPQTEDEAELVESMAEFRWLRQRCRPVQAQYDGQSVSPATDAAGRVSEPLGHTRIHSTIDVTKHRQRIERLWNQARSKLLELQKQRRLGLIEGAVKLPPNCYMDAEGQIIGPVAAPAMMPVLEARTGKIETDKTAAADSTGKGIGKYEEPKERGGVGEPQLAAPEPQTPRRVDSRGHLVGGFGARRIFLERPKVVPWAADEPLPGTSRATAQR